MKRRAASQSVRDLVEAELERHAWAALAGDTGSAWWALERAHIVSQAELLLHQRVHLAMLGYALRTFDVREAGGQLMRLLLAPLGALSGRTPLGNTGRARIDPFTPMPIPADLRRALDDVRG